jgi:hypothetical protein
VPQQLQEQDHLHPAAQLDDDQQHDEDVVVVVFDFVFVFVIVVVIVVVALGPVVDDFHHVHNHQQLQQQPTADE